MAGNVPADRLHLNQLLAALPNAELERLAPHFTSVQLNRGQTVYAAGDSLRYLLFPTTAVISIVYETRDGHSTEIGFTGRDGVVGREVFMSGDTAVETAVAHADGEAIRLSARTEREEFRNGGTLRTLLLRYAQYFIAQVGQDVVCSKMHSLERQIARRLLMEYDLLDAEGLQLTQEQVSGILGVRRESVSHAAANLQRRGLIAYTRGKIRLLDRRGLEAVACECYEVVIQQYNTIFNGMKMPAVRGKVR